MQEDHLKALLEDIRDLLDLVLKGQETLNRKLDEKFDEYPDRSQDDIHA